MMISLSTNHSPLPFSTYERNVYSQFGQDGVLEHVLSRHKPLSELVCFEVGGWDGVKFSNTCNLAKNHSSCVFFAEADLIKYQDILRNHRHLIDNNKVFAINAYVDNSANSINSILQRHNVESLDLLSIDVDGLDYYLFDRLDVDAAFVLIEFNHSIHLDISYVQQEDPALHIGASARALYELAQQKGYSLIHCFHTDLLFVKTSLATTYGISVLSLESVVLHGSIYAFTGYDGSLHTYTDIGSLHPGIICPWVGQLTKTSHSLQLLPSSFIFFPDSASASLPALFSRTKLLLRKLYLRFFAR